MSNQIKRWGFLRGTRKTTCPQCGRKGRFTPYMDLVTKQPIDIHKYGWCDREENCRYHEKPPADLFANEGKVDRNTLHPEVIRELNEQDEPFHSEIPIIEVIDSITADVAKTTLFRWLSKFYDVSLLRRVFSMFMVGYSPRYYGSPVYWQIDRSGSVRTGKIMGYNSETGKRVKEPMPFISWYHSVDFKLRSTIEERFILKQCLYGEHLINSYDKFCVVESEKTAIICTLEDLQANTGKSKTLWLACGGLGNIKDSLFRVLEGRNVTFYPDKGIGYTRWVEKVEDLSPEIKTNYKVSGVMERTPLKDGDDIADYIIYKKQKQTHYGKKI